MRKKLWTHIFLFFCLQAAYAQDKVNDVIFAEGANRYESEAIALALSKMIAENLEYYMKDSHFIYGPYCPENKDDCRQNLNFEITFKTSSVDLNNDLVKEVFVEYIAPGRCGSGGCSTYILHKGNEGWKVLGEIMLASYIQTSKFRKNGFVNIYYYSRNHDKSFDSTIRHTCYFIKNHYKCN